MVPQPAPRLSPAPGADPISPAWPQAEFDHRRELSLDARQIVLRVVRAESSQWFVAIPQPRGRRACLHQLRVLLESGSVGAPSLMRVLHEALRERLGSPAPQQRLHGGMGGDVAARSRTWTRTPSVRDTVRLISSQVHSTTLPPLLDSVGASEARDSSGKAQGFRTPNRRGKAAALRHLNAAVCSLIVFQHRHQVRPLPGRNH